MRQLIDLQLNSFVSKIHLKVTLFDNFLDLFETLQNILYFIHKG